MVEHVPEIGSAVIYVDPNGEARHAIATTVWSSVEAYKGTTRQPGINLVVVSLDPSKEDGYGRQIERATSVVHKSKQAAPGNFWRWSDEQ